MESLTKKLEAAIGNVLDKLVKADKVTDAVTWSNVLRNLSDCAGPILQLGLPPVGEPSVPTSYPQAGKGGDVHYHAAPSAPAPRPTGTIVAVPGP